MDHTSMQEGRGWVAWLLLAAFGAAALTVLGIGLLVLLRFGFWNFVGRQLEILWVMVWTTAVGLAATGLTFLAATEVLRLVRRRNVRVFISYQHTMEVPAARAGEALQSAGFTVEMIPYVPREDEHDAVIRDVLQKLRRSHVLIAVPAQEGAFFKAEILAAAYDHKPVLLIAVDQEFKIPDTAYRGYPVFDFAQLSSRAFVPLRQILRIAGRSRAAVGDVRSDVVPDALVQAVFLVAAAGLVIGVPLLLILPVLYAALWVRGDLDGLVYLLTVSRNGALWIFTAVLPLVLLWRSCRIFWKEWRVREGIRLRCERRELSSEDLERLLADRHSMAGVIDCLRRPGTLRGQ